MDTRCFSEDELALISTMLRAARKQPVTMAWVHPWDLGVRDTLLRFFSLSLNDTPDVIELLERDGPHDEVVHDCLLYTAGVVDSMLQVLDWCRGRDDVDVFSLLVNATAYAYTVGVHDAAQRELSPGAQHLLAERLERGRAVWDGLRKFHDELQNL